jgi:hypothetical protein
MGDPWYDPIGEYATRERMVPVTEAVARLRRFGDECMAQAEAAQREKRKVQLEAAAMAHYYAADSFEGATNG